MREVNENLGSQLSAATQMSMHLKNQLAEGDAVMRRLSRIAFARAGRREPEEPQPAAKARLAGQGGRRRGRSLRRAQEGKRPRRMKSLRDFRVLPVVLVAIFGLAVLKIAGIVLDGGYVFDWHSRGEAASRQAQQRSWAQETLNFPGAEGRQVRSARHHRLGASRRRKSRRSRQRRHRTRQARWRRGVSRPDAAGVGSERAVLERLQERRQELETRAREVDIRESLLKSAEKRIEAKVDEMKAVEARI